MFDKARSFLGDRQDDAKVEVHGLWPDLRSAPLAVNVAADCPRQTIRSARWPDSMVVLDGELDRLRDLWSCKLGDDVEREVDPRRDAARSEDIAIADDASLFVTGADHGQKST